MTTPRTWDLLAGIEACLQQITLANGYHFDAADSVTREPHQVPDDAGMVLSVVLERIETANDDNVRNTHRLAGALIVAKIDTGMDDAQLRLHELIADINQALSVGDRSNIARFDRDIQFPKFVSTAPIYPPQGLKWIGAEIRYASHYRSN